MKGKTLLIILGSVLGAVLVAGLLVVVFTTLKLQQALQPKAPTYSADDLASKAQAQIEQGNYQVAQNYLQQALQEDAQDDGTYRSQLAVVDYRLKDYATAIGQYQQLIAKGQDVAFAYNGIGNADRDWGTAHYAAAESAYRASIQADSTYVAAYSNLALLLSSEDQNAQALQVLATGIPATGNNAQLIALQKQLQQP